MKIRVTLELDFGVDAVDVINVAQVVRHRSEHGDGVFYFTTPAGRPPVSHVVAAWEVQKKYVPTIEP